MRAQRIKTGFHRVGVVGAALCGVPAVGLLAVGAVQAWTNGPDALKLAVFGTLWVIGAGATYLAARALGWIIAGFAGDGEAR
jgi:hypothetical protein